MIFVKEPTILTLCICFRDTYLLIHVFGDITYNTNSNRDIKGYTNQYSVCMGMYRSFFNEVIVILCESKAFNTRFLHVAKHYSSNCTRSISIYTRSISCNSDDNFVTFHCMINYFTDLYMLYVPIS